MATARDRTLGENADEVAVARGLGGGLQCSFLFLSRVTTRHGDRFELARKPAEKRYVEERAEHQEPHGPAGDGSDDHRVD